MSDLRPSGDDATVRMMRYDAGKKSVGIAYLLWVFVGSFGGHRFYLGSWGVGLFLLFGTLLAYITFGLTALLTLVILIWDLFTIPGKIRRHNEVLIASIG